MTVALVRIGPDHPDYKSWKMYLDRVRPKRKDKK